MADKQQLIKEKVDHSGLFDFKSFYSFALKWLSSEEYSVVEEKYSEKVAIGTGARDITIEWKASKKLSDYFKVELPIKLEFGELIEVEAEIDGKKKKLTKGKVSVEIKGIIIRDPDNQWDTLNWKVLRDIYNKYVIPQRIDNMDDIVIEDVKTLKNEMKSFLELWGKE